MGCKGNQLVVVWGIRRSGNHLIRDWIECQYERPTDNVFNAEPHYARLHTNSPLINTRVVGIEEKGVNTIPAMDWSGYNKCYKVIILRDPYNLFASRMKWYELEGRNGGAEFARLNYLDYADYFLNPREDVIPVSYNEFLRSETYRRDLCDKLGGTFEDTAIDIVSGFGSSFDAKDYHMKGREMKTTERWEQYRDNEFYRSLFTDEIKDVSEKIFGVRHF